MKKITKVHQIPGALILVGENMTYLYHPGRSSNPDWKKRFPRIKKTQVLDKYLLVQTINGNVTCIDLIDGKKIWHISPGKGEIFSFQYNFAVFTTNGVLKFYNKNGTKQWHYQSNGKLSTSPKMINKKLVLPLKNGQLVFLNPFYLGHRNTLQQVATRAAEDAYSSKNWPLFKIRIKDLLATEPGYSEAWKLKYRYFKEIKLDQDSSEIAALKTLINQKNTEDKSQYDFLSTYAEQIGATWTKFLFFNTNLHQFFTYDFYQFIIG